VYSHALGQVHSALRLGHFRYERPWLKDERRRKPKPQNLVAEATQRTQGWKRGEGERRILGAAQDLLRYFQSEANENIQKVYCSCKEGARTSSCSCHR